MRHSHGYRSRGRKIFRITPRLRGYRGLSRLMQEYNIGDTVVIDVNPTFIETAPHRRYQGKVGKIIERRGRAYVIEIRVGNKIKKIITTSEHIIPFKQAGS
ncbi:MAG: 50S ribosomal protein L21e [Infirmifilum sp.]|uniref:Large ribosomal subunit protein eL21 n=1 Tax=Infirmifilum uzonense TaxID=1550241 RepID=A0A0F7FIV8_9CREN|nr:50S ribosomal protein L21e [Infirmifilum uzonense]AKG39210.1 50S ribosomal protein L21 [Infirmifilum uzonense]